MLNANLHAARTVITEWIVDMTLISVNTFQLAHVLVAGPDHRFYVLLLLFISLSVFMQVCAT
jgi:hypothetical protein